MLICVSINNNVACLIRVFIVALIFECILNITDIQVYKNKIFAYIFGHFILKLKLNLGIR